MRRDPLRLSGYNAGAQTSETIEHNNGVLSEMQASTLVLALLPGQVEIVNYS